MLLGIFSALSVLSAFALCIWQDAFYGFSWLWMLPVGFFGALIVLLILWVLLLLVMTWSVDVAKPQKKDNRFYRRVIHLTVDMLMVLLRVKLCTEGTEKIPTDGRFLLVCNHLAEIDPAVLMTVFRKSDLAFISKQENDHRFLIGAFLHRIMCQPINRENNREALKTILRCVELLGEDQVSLGVFPEGYVSMDEKLHPFRPGVFKIAQKTGVPIVVCTLRDTQKMIRNAKKLKPTQIHVHLLDVIQPEEFKGVPTVQIAQRIHDMMAADLGPENVL